LSIHNSKNFSRSDRCRAVTATAASVVAMMVAMPMSGTNVAHAQDQSAQAPSIEQIVVTGSRIVRDGFEAPTPVSVLSIEDLNTMAEPNIADAVNRLPALQRSLGTTNSSTNVSSGTGGVNNLNLRGLSAVRTLVLLDGKRIVGASLAGFENNGSVPDINNFPSGLVSRVDVVTGGASAVYGSDALAGVVNFVLDKEFTGVKGDISGGVSTYGDNEEYKINLTMGTPFANGRGHFLLFGEHNASAGVKGDGGRAHGKDENRVCAINNPAFVAGGGQPSTLITDQCGLAVATAGGLITGDDVNGNTFGNASPFRGIQFLAGGKQAPFEFGENRGGLLMTGGDFQQSNIWSWPTMNLKTNRTNVFTRADFDITDNVNLYGELSWAVTKAQNDSVVPNFRFGVTIPTTNPFMPDDIRQAMIDQGISSLRIGTFIAAGPRTPLIDPATGDTPYDIKAFNERYMRRYVGGLEGTFMAMDTDWSWDAYYARSTTHNGTRSPDNLIPGRFNMAVQAVTDPVTGATVCAVNGDADPSNDQPDCAPFNIFGTDVNGVTEAEWIVGSDYAMTILSQDVFAATFSGEPFESPTGAGPISVAFGGEHRIEKVRGLDSELGRTRQFFAGNYRATTAKWSVTEGFFETFIPLAADESWARSLDLNAAVRYADYSESGGEVTWKVGATYAPIDELTLRVTKSRDIRAPNLGDLFNEGRAGTGSVEDPFQLVGGVPKVTADVVTADVGNPLLEPERADTTGVGIVYSPDFVPGLTASIDYYRINVKGAISNVNRQDLIDGCFAGAAVFCEAIDRVGGGNGSNVTGDVIFVRQTPQNVLTQFNDGLDVEFAYSTPLDALWSGMDGDIQARGLLTKVFNLNTEETDPVTGAVNLFEGAGINADGGAGTAIGTGLVTSDLIWDLSLSYTLDKFNTTVTWRGTGAGKYRNDFVVCQSSCPAPVQGGETINSNHIPAVSYVDLAVSYDIMDNATAYLSIRNLTNRDAPIIATSSFFGGLDNDNYDRIGRMFRAGVRFSM
jgi:iron complex outermembrane recepter protein